MCTTISLPMTSCLPTIRSAKRNFSSVCLDFRKLGLKYFHEKEISEYISVREALMKPRKLGKR